MEFLGGTSHGLIGRLLERLIRVKPESDAPEWGVQIFTTGVNDLAKAPRLNFLDLNLLGENGVTIDVEKEGQDLANWEKATWHSLDNKEIGVSYAGKLRIPEKIGKPLLAIFKHTGGMGSFFVSRLVLTPPAGKEAVVKPLTFAVNSHIHAKQGPRVFFDEQLRLPKDTPKILEQYRKAELSELRGTEELRHPTAWARVYQYDVYNDLGQPDKTNKTDKTDKTDRKRPILGGLFYKDGASVYDSKADLNQPETEGSHWLGGGSREEDSKRALKYPRRLRTGRGHYKDTLYEAPPTLSEPLFWLPLDEQFDHSKRSNFLRGAGLTILSAINGILSHLADKNEHLLPAILKSVKKNSEPFPDFDNYQALYKSAAEDAEVNISEFEIAVAKALGQLDASMVAILGAAFEVDEKAWTAFLQGVRDGKSVLLNAEARKVLEPLCKFIRDIVYETPLVIAGKGREDLWRTDEEWGREVIAGQNPCIIQAVKSIPPESKVSAQDIEPFLGGLSLADVLASEKPRLFMVDYSSVYPDFTKLINKDGDRFQYAGRAFLFLRGDGQLVPVAIELFTGEAPAVVYTPAEPPNVWLVAKTVFSSIDSGFHQLYSHFTRTHASVEPALIATRRQLSAMHPVYNLLMPHFRFTLNINRDARQLLINQGAVIEQAFTPGKYSMTIAAAAYGALWSFESQALPNDLMARGMAKKGADGKVEMVLPDYPFGSDGMLVWDAVEKWVSGHLSLYYTGVNGATVANDPEINAWWDDFKNEGHPDVKEGWPKLETVADLTQIVTTIIWTASAQHAAVNFGQYAYSGYMPNRSSIVHRPIPAKGTKEYKDLAANLDRNFFKTVAKPIEAVLVMTVIRLLSSHSENEQYISDKEHHYIFDEKARELYNEHVKTLLAAEQEMDNRNNDKNSTARNKDKGGLPYELLFPTSSAGLTGRGIPTSVSI